MSVAEAPPKGHTAGRTIPPISRPVTAAAALLASARTEVEEGSDPPWRPDEELRPPGAL